MNKVYVVQILNYKHNYYEEANNPEIYVYKSRKDASRKLLTCFKDKINECEQKTGIDLSDTIFYMQDEDKFIIRNNNINYTGTVYCCDIL